MYAYPITPMIENKNSPRANSWRFNIFFTNEVITICLKSYKGLYCSHSVSQNIYVAKWLGFYVTRNFDRNFWHFSVLCLVTWLTCSGFIFSANYEGWSISNEKNMIECFHSQIHYTCLIAYRYFFRTLHENTLACDVILVARHHISNTVPRSFPLFMLLQI